MQRALRYAPLLLLLLAGCATIETQEEREQYVTDWAPFVVTAGRVAGHEWAVKQTVDAALEMGKSLEHIAEIADAQGEIPPEYWGPLLNSALYDSDTDAARARVIGDWLIRLVSRQDKDAARWVGLWSAAAANGIYMQIEERQK